MGGGGVAWSNPACAEITPKKTIERINEMSFIYPRFGGGPLSVLEFQGPARHFSSLQPNLTPAERRRLKGRAQLLDPVLKVGHNGVSDAFLASVEHELALHELIKIKFAAFKEERRELSERIAAATGSALLQVVGHVAVFYRPRPAA